MSSPADVGRRRATTDIAIQIVGRAFNIALGVVVTLVIVRTLGEAGFGRWATVFAVTQVVGYLAELGLDMVAVREASADRRREPEWIGGLLSLRVVMALPASLGCAGLLLLIGDDADMRITGLLISGAILLSAPTALRTVFQLRVRNGLNILVITVHSVLWGAAVVGIAVADGGMVEFAVAFAAVTCLTTILQVALALRAAPIRVRGSHAVWPTLTRVGLTVGISGALTLAYGRIDQVLVFELAGSRDAGLYGAVYRILDQSAFVPAAVMTTLLPIMSASYAVDVERVRRLVQTAANYLAVASLPALAFSIAASEPIVRLLFGPDFAEASRALPILMGAFVFISLGYLAGYVSLVLDLQRKYIGFALVALVFNVALNFLLVPSYGFVAAAWITLATEVVVLSLATRAIARRIALRPRVGRIFRAGIAAASMGVAVWLLRDAGVPLGGLAFAAVAVYSALLLPLGAVDRREIAALVRREAV